jgi:NAD(P)-dependent dehydrogenase (short-subunit alcohol dehydrogenase family)
VALARAGYDVGLLARGQAGVEAAASDVLAEGGRALAVQADVADWEAVHHAASEIERSLGPIDVWVNDAMATVFAPVRDIDAAEIRRATEVTYLGQVHGALAALEVMRPRDRGVIVSVGSALAFRAIPLQAPYCGAKFAVRGFMQALRTELLHEGSGIRVAQVHLPAVNTPQFVWSRSKVDDQPQPVPPIYEPEVAARAIVAAARNGRRQRIVGVWNRLVIYGNRAAPGVFDHFAARTGWSSQQVAGEHVGARDGNLEKPCDEPFGSDHGAHGPFDDRARGMLAPAFLRSIGQVGRDVAAAMRDRFAEVIRRHAV